MKVLDQSCPLYSDNNMTKRRKARNQYQENSSDESESVNGSKQCLHVSKSLNFRRLQKLLSGKRITPFCSGCANNSCSNDHETEDKTIWLCLQCGYQGCGRGSKSMHALKHSESEDANEHKLVVNLNSFIVWCYVCDNEVLIRSKNLEDAINYLRKIVDYGSNSSSDDVKVPLTVESTLNSGKSAKTRIVSPQSRPKLKGLSNLGNTCFFNAVMQSLSQIKELGPLLNDSMSKTSITLPGFDRPESSDSDNSDNEDAADAVSCLEPRCFSLAEDRSSLTNALNQVLKELSSDSSKYTVNPKELFDQICKKVPRFKGYQQQDSHELLRNLLDHVKSEELRRVQLGILQSFNYKTLQEKAKQQNSEIILKEKKLTERQIKLYGQQAKWTTVDSLFGGYLLSTVICRNCDQESQIFESFLDLSLPVYEEKNQRVRRPSKTAADDEDFTAVDSSKGPSKHQLKKAKQGRKKFNKQKKPSVISTNLEEDNVSKPVQKEEVISVAGTNADQTAADTVHSSSSRTNTPKSGYTSDSEESEKLENSLETTAKNLENLTLEDCKLDIMTEPDEKESVVKKSYKMLATKLPPTSQDCSILSCLGQFTRSECLTKPNQYACSYCNKREKHKRDNPKEKSATVYSDADKYLCIYSPPAILTLHLKRFQRYGYSFSKVQRHVDFTVTLDIAPFCSSLAQGVEPGQTSVKYLLFAVIEHSGSLSNGHYTAYVRNRHLNKISKSFRTKALNDKPLRVLLDRMNEFQLQNENKKAECTSVESTSTESSSSTSEVENYRWYHISDSHVKEVNERTVLSSQAYILFYERIR